MGINRNFCSGSAKRAAEAGAKILKVTAWVIFGIERRMTSKCHFVPG